MAQFHKVQLYMPFQNNNDWQMSLNSVWEKYHRALVWLSPGFHEHKFLIEASPPDFVHLHKPRTSDEADAVAKWFTVMISSVHQPLLVLSPKPLYFLTNAKTTA